MTTKNDTLMTAAERVYRILLEKILANEFVPGKRLPRRKLAEITGVSQIPVLEAMKRLEQEGLLEYRPHWGCVVIVPNVKRLQDMYALREAIECQVVRILALEISESHLAELTRIAENLDALHSSNTNMEMVLELHHGIHLAMAEFTGRLSLVSTLRRANLIWMFWSGVRSIRSRFDVPQGWHMRLVDAIRKGNPVEAERIMRAHINRSFQALLSDLDFRISGK